MDDSYRPSSPNLENYAPQSPGPADFPIAPSLAQQQTPHRQIGYNPSIYTSSSQQGFIRRQSSISYEPPRTHSSVQSSSHQYRESWSQAGTEFPQHRQHRISPQSAPLFEVPLRQSPTTERPLYQVTTEYPFAAPGMMSDSPVGHGIPNEDVHSRDIDSGYLPDAGTANEKKPNRRSQGRPTRSQGEAVSFNIPRPHYPEQDLP